MLTETNIHVESLPAEALEEAASVVAAAMLHNPLHLSVFRSANERSFRRQHKLFMKVLSLPACNLVVAKQHDTIVGVMNYYLPGKCQVSTMHTLKMLPGLAGILGSSLPAVLKWKSKWARHDPDRPHLHFGPLAVLPQLQGKGIGSMLLNQFCRLADVQNADAYLETDKEENLPLYKKFGFAVVDEDMVCGVQNWFMWRNAQAGSNNNPSSNRIITLTPLYEKN